MKYAIACRTPWFWDELRGQDLEGERVEFHTPAELTVEALERFGPRYVFFPHWSHIVPAAIFERFECVCFHATPVPYGRGGSPIQNMIVRGHQSSTVTALRMVAEIDAGPVYLQNPVSLLGSLDEILVRISKIVLQMMRQMLASPPQAVPQSGDVVLFKRRTPLDSAIPPSSTLQAWFDHIRMLDADGYPRAFVDVGPMRLEFSRAIQRDGRIETNVSVAPRPPGGDD